MKESGHKPVQMAGMRVASTAETTVADLVACWAGWTDASMAVK